MTSSVICGVDHSPHARAAARFAAQLARAVESQLEPMPVVRSHDDERSDTTAAGIRSLSTEGASKCAQAAWEAAIIVAGTSATPVVVGSEHT